MDYQTEGGGTVFDRQSIAQYLDSLGVTGWMRELLDVAYVTEYGLDAGEQSALNFIFLIGTGDLEGPRARSSCSARATSATRYAAAISGSSMNWPSASSRRFSGGIASRRSAAKRPGYTLTFQTDGGAVDEDADVVVLAIPFTMLREVKIDVELPAVKKQAIQELGYGANAKVLVGFRNRPWQKQGYSGATYSDEPFQLAWDNSFLQTGAAGGLTLYSGGKLALDVGQGTAEEVAARLMAGIERAYPGATRAAQRQGLALPLADVPVDQGQLLLSTSPGSGRPSPAPRGCPSATSSSPANTAATTSRAT